MKFFIVAVRLLAALVGFFVLLFCALDVLGLRPYSIETPPLVHRVAHCIPLAIASLALLIPYRRITSAAVSWIFVVILVLVATYVLFITVTGFHAYLAGEKSWHVVPASLVLSTIVVGNLYAFYNVGCQRYLEGFSTLNRTGIVVVSKDSPSREPQLSNTTEPTERTRT